MSNAGAYRDRSGEWAWALVGQPGREGPFVMEIGDMVERLGLKDAERLRVWGYKNGWRMRRDGNDDGTYNVTRIDENTERWAVPRKVPVMFLGQKIGSVGPRSLLLKTDKLTVLVGDESVELLRDGVIKVPGQEFKPAPSVAEALAAKVNRTHPDGTFMTEQEILDLEAERSF